jgi:hypothetical protein
MRAKGLKPNHIDLDHLAIGFIAIACSTSAPKALVFHPHERDTPIICLASLRL